MNKSRGFLQTLIISVVWLVVAGGIYTVIAKLDSSRKESRFTIENNIIEIERSYDGHYYWSGSVNGVPVTFLIDTGASITTIPESVVHEAGLPLGASIQLQTANGVRNSHLVKGDLCLDGGICINPLSMTIAHASEDTGLLGMNVISKMTWTQSNNIMRFDVSTLY